MLVRKRARSVDHRRRLFVEASYQLALLQIQYRDRPLAEPTNPKTPLKN